MEIIEIGGNSFCLRTLSSAVPCGDGNLRSFAEKTLAEEGFFLSSSAEITAYSNGFYTLLFVSDRSRPSHRGVYSFCS